MSEHESGDDYIRRVATFIRTNERALGEGGLARRRPRQQASGGWFGPTPPPKPMTFSIDTQRLFYILMRMEEAGLPVGTLDVRIDAPSRPLSYINLFPDSDKSETLSLASFRSSLSVVSSFSLSPGWWGKPPPPPLETELRYLYSAFTRLPALHIVAPGRKTVAEIADQPPNENALPLDAFKLVEVLVCNDIDPRALLGWDQLAINLKSLTIKQSGLEDISDVFIGAVIDDQARREGSVSRKRNRKIPVGPERQASFYSSQVPETVREEDEVSEPSTPLPTLPQTTPPSPPPPTTLSPSKWASLKHLSLPDNALTSFPSDLIPYLTSITHLDLSFNLLVSVPSGLGALYNLVSLNLADNMIDSVLGIYLNLGQVLVLNLARNRLESICGLERLHALERVDLRENIIEEVGEIGRLATLPNIKTVFVAGNPFTDDDNYRAPCFDLFWKEGKSISLDGAAPSYYEKRGLTVAPAAQMSSSRPVSVAYSPPTVAVGHAHEHHARNQASPSSSSATSPNLVPIGLAAKPRKKKVKRIVDLDGDQEHSDGSSQGHGHQRMKSDESRVSRKARPKPTLPTPRDNSPLSAQKEWGRFEDLVSPPEPVPEGPAPEVVAPSKARTSRHSRYQTEYTPAQEMLSSTPPSASTFARSMRRPQTLTGRAGARRARVSSSVYEPPTSSNDGAVDETMDSAEAYRRKVEALKKDMGDGWLKVFSQTQMSPSAA
ncbi:hypothetical protein CYLTODRAFT_439200 [Cylindrobasidium torrendii FP15055 ss-10]|uniref:L domain-like protein n=1 Tax=Cylindrobasidium torrendii FP15055 ss-10 TaxID=1314674 RepID=A0A0D7BVQ7_9AGAR|nr:hypothetical protein CYLTODRAFT_439200 [Cylindrobasidium torrendii FP15055 ss-10]